MDEAQRRRKLVAQLARSDASALRVQEKAYANAGQPRLAERAKKAAEYFERLGRLDEDREEG